MRDDPAFRDLKLKFPALMERFDRQLSGGGRSEFTARRLAAGTPNTEEEALYFLRRLASAGWLQESVLWVCPHHDREELTPEEAAAGICREDPQLTFDPKEARQMVYWCERPRECDIQWVLALHGMNTLGAWQEDFNWLVSRSYGRMIPVKIYKYGKVRAGAVLRCLQKFRVRQLHERLRKLAGEAADGGFGPRPDVIAHSFGTWLLGHALLKYPKLEVGRVILTGSILRPDFPWRALIEAGRVTAVLNHFGTRDFWAWVAQYVIPDSGPSGRRGFDDAGALNVPAKGFSHSQFFRPWEMPQLFRSEEPKGLWHDFLTAPASELQRLAAVNQVPRPGWKPTVWPLRATLPRFLVLALAAVLAALLAAALGRGLADLWRLAID